MQVLEPENTLELVDTEVRIDFLELRALLVHLEDTLPLGIDYRRQDAHKRAPVDHRQAGTCQPSEAAQHDHRKHEPAANQEPGCDGTVLRLLIYIDIHLQKRLSVPAQGKESNLRPSSRMAASQLWATAMPMGKSVRIAATPTQNSAGERTRQRIRRSFPCGRRWPVRWRPGSWRAGQPRRPSRCSLCMSARSAPPSAIPVGPISCCRVRSKAVPQVAAWQPAAMAVGYGLAG